ncbi:hypothetical protein BGY98DRAFT_932343 [Russula aff. rugulosa BPL654]|nr:hypothetical protein BGY98DRAFT_932343 [Russula aff. rugulosa BPL654]
MHAPEDAGGRLAQRTRVTLLAIFPEFKIVSSGLPVKDSCDLRAENVMGEGSLRSRGSPSHSKMRVEGSTDKQARTDIDGPERCAITFHHSIDDSVERRTTVFIHEEIPHAVQHPVPGLDDRLAGKGHDATRVGWDYNLERVLGVSLFIRQMGSFRLIILSRQSAIAPSKWYSRTPLNPYLFGGLLGYWLEELRLKKRFLEGFTISSQRDDRWRKKKILEEAGQMTEKNGSADSGNPLRATLADDHEQDDDE